MSVNKVILVGRLGADPESRNTNSGLAVANLRIATSERQKKGDEWVEHTEWHRVVVFGKQAESVSRFLTKGRQVYVEGRLRTRKWQDKEGNDRYSTEIVGDRVQFLGSKDGGGGQGGSQNSGGGYGGGGYGGGGPASDDIPF